MNCLTDSSIKWNLENVSTLHILMPCSHHTSPGRKPQRYLLTFDVYGPCDLWRAGVDGIANRVSQSVAIF